MNRKVIERASLVPSPRIPSDFADRYVAAGYWTEETFQHFLGRRAETFSDSIAVVDGDTRLSYREVSDRADRFAAGLAERGLRPGDRVVVQLPNIAEYVVVIFGIFRLGAVPVFALPAHRRTEMNQFVDAADACAYVIADIGGGFDYRTLAREVVAASDRPPLVIVIGDPEEFVAFDDVAFDDVASEAVDVPDVAADSVAFLQLSGGTTGAPKLIPRTHADYLYSVRGSADICECDKNTRILVVLPAAHNFPMSSPGILGVLHAGGTVVMAPDPTPSTAFEIIERERITMVSLVPPLVLAWMNAPSRHAHDLSSLQVLQAGGAKFSSEAARRVRTELGCTLQQVFGMAEGLVNYTRLDDPEDVIVTTQGRPISPDDEIRVVDDNGDEVSPGSTGHLLTRGPYTIRGYYNAPEHNATAFTPDGFYRTGDIVRVVEGGYIIVEGRAKDQINRGGEKVAAEEVENHLLAHESVVDAAVVSQPDQYMGERTCAFVITHGTRPSKIALKKFVRERGLASYKVPDSIVFVDEFPVTGVGKISKNALRRALEKTLVD
ncbi:(2,3-dihydroxybenzoyl)adenylate synthase [Rhodococcoides yunnanense]|uniref:(2,3-dihydroxybenzoyl)adenylate synthase n=1 Tax=Rhodococcoides yunnanense TaxID=278209 RepID=UPI00093418DB|nr:(2,3-dihydroxybenzoyl)adenylate synthase [Rhodococcus yunnanensis]